MKYYFNITKVKKKDLGVGFPKTTPRRIPVRRGRFNCPWDVLKSEMKKKWYALHLKWHRKTFGVYPYKDAKIPMGIKRFPEGAFIEKVDPKVSI